MDLFRRALMADYDFQTRVHRAAKTNMYCSPQRQTTALPLGHPRQRRILLLVVQLMQTKMAEIFW